MTLKDIRQVARDLLIEEDLPAVTINAVARRLGMSGPAIYRYYASHEDLITALTDDFHSELTAAVEAVRVAGQVNLVAMARALRRWALDNRAGFRMIFASPPVPAQREQAGREGCGTAHAFEEVFFEEVEAIWKTKRFPVPELEMMPPRLSRQLEAFAGRTGERLPPEALYVFLNCWIRLYGLLCMEVLEQIDFAVADAEPLFEECLQELCGWLEIEYRTGS